MHIVPAPTLLCLQVAAMFHIASSKGPPEIPQHLSPECKDFLYLCFNRDWKARPLASTLLRHPFLADVPVRSQGGGPSPSAALLAQVGLLGRSRQVGPWEAWRSCSREGACVRWVSVCCATLCSNLKPQPSGRGPLQAWRAPRASGVPAAAPEPSDGQFGTPSPLNPKLAGVPGGAARISLQTTEGGTPGDGAAALSPLGQHAPRRPQWDSAAAPAPSQKQQQQQQPGLSREFSARLGGSPSKRVAMSLRASAPVFSGYASVALSQQLEPLAPRPAPPAAASTAAQEARAQPTVSGALRGSVESGASGAASSAAAGASGASSQLHQSELRRSGSGVQREEEVVSQAADPAAAETQVPAQEADQPAPPAAQVQEPLEEEGVIGPTASETPAALRQRPGVQDLLQPGVQPGGPAGATPSSGGNSSGTNKVGEPGRTSRPVPAWNSNPSCAAVCHLARVPWGFSLWQAKVLLAFSSSCPVHGARLHPALGQAAHASPRCAPCRRAITTPWRSPPGCTLTSCRCWQTPRPQAHSRLAARRGSHRQVPAAWRPPALRRRVQRRRKAKQLQQPLRCSGLRRLSRSPQQRRAATTSTPLQSTWCGPTTTATSMRCPGTWVAGAPAAAPSAQLRSRCRSRSRRRGSSRSRSRRCGSQGSRASRRASRRQTQ